MKFTVVLQIKIQQKNYKYSFNFNGDTTKNIIKHIKHNYFDIINSIHDNYTKGGFVYVDAQRSH